ncbi:uncharacterized protein [Nothobranchius furzeri]|uniref:uncharacterized protein isoform X1 n=1 Tax=Nothobranchius furzeri TaxID=105023 RepID=UPI00390468D5
MMNHEEMHEAPSHEEEVPTTSDASTSTQKVKEESVDTPLSKTMLCEKSIAIHQMPAGIGAPRKSTFYICRVQVPPFGGKEILEQIWQLEPYGYSGSFGYRFSYDTKELCLIQDVAEGEPLKSYLSNSPAVLSYNDWAVLRLAVPRKVHRDDEERPRPPVNRSGPQALPTLDEIQNAVTAFSASWEGEEDADGEWMFKASVRVRGFELFFVLENVHSVCGIYRLLQVVPFEAWCEKINEVEDRITSLFRTSRCWNDILTVRKKLEF